MNATELLKALDEAVKKHGPETAVMLDQHWHPGLARPYATRLLLASEENELLGYGFSPGQPVLIIDLEWH